MTCNFVALRSHTTRNRYVPDILKAQQQLSLRVTVSLAEVIRRTGAAAQAAMSLDEPKGAPQPG
ncbi:hypothetical protein [Synechococcus sp. Cruz CV12-2-Slac-r]|uniref:hypothetical protein n=1 Tax=Synechococcus sp. Cruz CV12-2-Slac-r TaxID=2823748 RepID=UPI0020CD93C1|nr:hypothetical protein [Synechococcus sp. Cruz CV12-2-Slac-r]MCP9940548.1 hypothetical protein [Synechococcus sp. Cruz CV12-2-Slac-r]